MLSFQPSLRPSLHLCPTCHTSLRHLSVCVLRVTRRFVTSLLVSYVSFVDWSPPEGRNSSTPPKAAGLGTDICGTRKELVGGSRGGLEGV
eukprot:5445351-Pyramimonas_sp.AAC.1